MNRTLTIVLIVIGILVVAAGLFAFGVVYGRNVLGFNSPVAGNAWDYSYGPGMMNDYRGPGMMDRRGGYGPGMMERGGYGPGGMMGGYGPGGMMGGYGYGRGTAATAPLTVEQAQAAAEKYLASLNNADLKVAEIMIFDNNAYVAVKESSTGIGAFELLVDPVSQVAYPEHGPNMMWNTKYAGLNHQYMMGGYGGGMMRGYDWNGTVPGQASGDMTVTADQAVAAAQKYLDAEMPGTTAATDPMQFYGYYTLDFTRDGKVAGMLSVNGYTGQVFLHTWHGTFVEESTLQ